MDQFYRYNTFFINKADQVTNFLINNQYLVQKYQTDISFTDIEFETFIFRDITEVFQKKLPKLLV